MLSLMTGKVFNTQSQRRVCVYVCVLVGGYMCQILAPDTVAESLSTQGPTQTSSDYVGSGDSQGWQHEVAKISRNEDSCQFWYNQLITPSGVWFRSTGLQWPLLAHLWNPEMQFSPQCNFRGTTKNLYSLDPFTILIKQIPSSPRIRHSNKKIIRIKT